MTTLLRSITRDLFERRLWPIAALLVLGLVAVPVLFLHSSKPDGHGLAPAAADAAPHGPSSPLDGPYTGSVKGLPPALAALVQGQQVGPGSGISGTLKDPFAGPAVPAASPGGATPGVGGTPTASAASAASAAGVAGGTGSATSVGSSGLLGAGSSGLLGAGSSGSAGAGTGSTSLALAQSAPGGTSGASTPGAGAPRNWTIFRTDVRYGPDDRAPVARDVARLQVFPSPARPVAIFLGVVNHGAGAAFAVRTDATPFGAKACRPNGLICSWLVVAAGGHVDLRVPTGAGRAVHERLAVVHVRRTTTTSLVAVERAYLRIDPAGRCLLGPLAAYRFDGSDGTLAQRPGVAGCRFSPAPTLAG